MIESDLLQTISEAWGWIGIQPRLIARENDFGNLIVQDLEARYWRLIPDELSCEVVAENRRALDRLTVDPEFLEDWHMVNLISAAREKLGELSNGKKYYFVIPPVLGGEYSVTNMQTILLPELIGLSCSLAYQLQNLPDGAKIRLVVD